MADDADVAEITLTIEAGEEGAPAEATIDLMEGIASLHERLLRPYSKPRPFNVNIKELRGGSLEVIFIIDHFEQQPLSPEELLLRAIFGEESTNSESHVQSAILQVLYGIVFMLGTVTERDEAGNWVDDWRVTVTERDALDALDAFTRNCLRRIGIALRQVQATLTYRDYRVELHSASALQLAEWDTGPFLDDYAVGAVIELSGPPDADGLAPGVYCDRAVRVRVVDLEFSLSFQLLAASWDGLVLDTLSRVGNPRAGAPLAQIITVIEVRAYWVKGTPGFTPVPPRTRARAIAQ